MKKAKPQSQIIPTDYGVFQIDEKEADKYLKKIKKPTTEIVFFGSDLWSVHVLKNLVDNFGIRTVVCATDSPVANYFKGIVLTPQKLDEDFISNNYHSLAADLFVVASYGKIIPQTVLDIPKFGALNLHPSLLPKFRGPSPVPATILSGDKETGITIIKVDEKMDHGPIVFTKKISLLGQETFEELINKLFLLGAEVLVEIIPQFIEGKISLQPQDDNLATYCKLIRKEDGYFEIDNPPEPLTLDRMIRAYNPWPGVWTKWKGKVIKFFPENKMQMEGKRVVSKEEFLNGYQDFPIR